MNKNKLYKFFIFLLLIGFPYFSVWRVYKELGRPKILSENPPNIVKNLEKVSETVGDRRVFMSGSGVFWANAFFDIYQVRGGRDGVSINPFWRDGAYVLRRMEDVNKAVLWIDRLGVEYSLVHTQYSDEYYHDFRNYDKWSSLGQVVWENNGDVLVILRK